MSKRNWYYRYASLAARLQRRQPLGKNIYSADWDVCIILDSARADLFDQVATESPHIGASGRAWSVGSITTEWLANTFTTEYAADIADTTLVSATPHTQTVFDDRDWLTNETRVAVSMPESNAVRRSDFDAVHELWRTHCGPHDVVHPETMRDATLEAAKQTGSERVVAHWMQPHEPFIAPDAPLLGGSATGKNVWRGLQEGRLDRQEVWESYRKTLRYALRYVDDVLENVDGRVLITADHGNAFGEWGVYGHPFAWPQPAVRRVPWALVDCTDRGRYEFTSVLDEQSQESDRNAQLEALGYR